MTASTVVSLNYYVIIFIHREILFCIMPMESIV